MFKNACSSFSTPLGLTTIVLLVAFGLLMPAPAYAGGCLLAAGPSVPTLLAVGESTNATFTLVAISPKTGASDDCEFIKVTPGDTIEAVLSCGNALAGAPPQLCPPGALDPGVFLLPAPGSTFTGKAGSACAGITFTISAADPGGATTGGHVFFTPSSTFTLESVFFPSGTACSFMIPTTVLKEPTKDSQPGQPGLQTNQFGFATGAGFQTDGTTLIGSASGTGSSDTTIGQCQAQVDKQVSCDGGATYQDVGLVTANGDGTFGCIAPANGNVLFRYQLRNADATFEISSCTLTDSNGSITVPSINGAFPLATLTTSALFTTASPLACTAANFGGTREPDTATLNCICAGAPPNFQVAATVTDSATVGCCGVAVNKVASCGTTSADNPGPGGMSIVTGTACVQNNEDGTGSCSTTVGKNVTYSYFAQNIGTVNAVCNLGDTGGPGGAFNIGSAMSQIISLPATTTSCAALNVPAGTAVTNTQACTCPGGATSCNFTDTAALSCTCSASFATTTATALDAANVACTPAPPPSFTAQKTCTAAGGNEFNVGVTVTNTDALGGSSLSCTIVDQTFAGACGVGTPTAGPSISPSTLTVAANPSGSSCASNGTGCTTSIGTGTFTSSTAVCNQATVTCTSGTTTLAPQIATAECMLPTGGIKITKVFAEDFVAPGAPALVTFTVVNHSSITITHVAFSDVFPPHTTSPNIAATAACNGGTYSVTSDVLKLSGGSLAAGQSCSVTVTLTADPAQTTPLRVCDTTSPVTSDQITSNPAYACITIGPAALAPSDSFQINYASNLGIGDSVVNLTNTGALNGTDPDGNICVNVYAFDPAEELIACCSCLVTPNALNSLSVNQDLTSNVLTPGKASAVVIKLLANAPDPGLCNPASPNFQNLTPGLLAWGTTLHQEANTNGYRVTESPFLPATLSPSELMKVTSYCGFIQLTGSGFGICKSCRVGGLGAASK